jgi:hypothetical protein
MSDKIYYVKYEIRPASPSPLPPNVPASAWPLYTAPRALHYRTRCG